MQYTKDGKPFLVNIVPYLNLPCLGNFVRSRRILLQVKERTIQMIIDVCQYLNA